MSSVNFVVQSNIAFEIIIITFTEFHINKFDTTTDDDEGDAKQLPKFPQNQNAGAEHNAVASPSREVSPKFVVAGKKYGRRSRPPSEAFENWSSNSDTDTAPSNESTRLAAANDHQEPRHHSTPKGSPKESSLKVYPHIVWFNLCIFILYFALTANAQKHFSIAQKHDVYTILDLTISRCRLYTSVLTYIYVHNHICILVYSNKSR